DQVAPVDRDRNRAISRVVNLGHTYCLGRLDIEEEWTAGGEQQSTRRLRACASTARGGFPMSELVILTRDGDVGVVTLNNPPASPHHPHRTAVVPARIEVLPAAFQGLRQDAAITAIVIIGGGRTFCGGADIKEFGKLTSGQKSFEAGLNPLLGALEDCPKPVV